MAPSRPPPSPPRDPRLSQSSSSYRVPKRPAPIVSPRLQSSGRSEAIRGIGRSIPIAGSIYTDDYEDWTSRVSSESEGDEHTATQVDLSMLGTALEESIRDSHNELENRVSKEERSPLLDQVSQHLLVSPPSSPDSLHSESSPPSPASKKRIAQSRLKQLDELMKRDADLHNLMRDLAGIREWWKGNKRAWYEMREKIRGLDNQIFDLQTQADQHYQMIGTDRSHLRNLYGSTVGFIDERWAPQIEELMEQREINLAWFEENRELMKKVWARVQEITDTVYLEVEASKKLVSSYPATHDISKLSWFQQEDKGLKWWLRQARKDVEILRDRIQNLLDADHAQAEYRALEIRKLEGQLKFWQDALQDGDFEADMQISELRQHQRKGYNIEIRQILNARQIRRVDSFREEYDVKEMIQDLQLRDQQSILMRKILSDIFERNRQIRRRLNEICRNPPNISPAGSRSDICFYTDIYHLVRHHIHRTIQGPELGTSLDQVSYSQTKRKKIIARINEYPDSDTEAFFLDFVARLGPKNAPVDCEALSSLTAESRREAVNFTTMVKDCQEIIKELDPAFKPLKNPTHPAAYLLPNIRNVTLKKTPPESPFDLARTLGSTIPLITCQSILKQAPKEPVGTHADTHYPWYELLRDFLTSPDIFPLFRSNTYAGGRRSWNKEEFFTNINALLKTPVDHHILEAFLSYCSHTGDLFRMSEFRRRIEMIPEGWELCEENPVRGLYRKVPASSLPRPRDIDRLEHILRQHWRDIGCENPDRKIAEEDLRKFLNYALPNDHRISKEQMRQAVSYWSNVGHFFVLVNPFDEFQDPFTSIPLLRIDNGFPLPASLPLLPPPNPPRNHEFIMDVFQSQTTWLSSMLKRCRNEGRVLDERMLYRFLFLDGRERGMNWEVSRHEFHLFLRWESGRGGVVFMGREGGLGFVSGRESESASARGSGNGSGSGSVSAMGLAEVASGSRSGTGSLRGMESDSRVATPSQIERDPRTRDDDADTYTGIEWRNVNRRAQQE